MRAAGALRAQWSEWSGLPEQSTLVAALRRSAAVTDEVLVTKGTPRVSRPEGAKTLGATYFWPMLSHGSIGPSCAVADVRADAATIWTASQGTHGNRNTFARFLGLPREKVRLIYLDGSGCYGMNGHEDAAVDAAILSQAIGRPVRVTVVARGRTRLGSQGAAATARYFRHRRASSSLRRRNSTGSTPAAAASSSVKLSTAKQLAGFPGERSGAGRSGAFFSQWTRT